MRYIEIIKFLIILWTFCVVSVTSEENIEKRDVIHRIVIMDKKPKKHKNRHKDHHHHHHSSNEYHFDYFKHPSEHKNHKHKHSFEDDSKSFSRENSFEHKYKASGSHHRPHYKKRPKFDSSSEESKSEFQQEHNFEDHDWRPLIGKSRPTVTSPGYLENPHKEKKKKHPHNESHHKSNKSQHKKPNNVPTKNNHKRPNRPEYTTNVSPNILPFQSFPPNFEQPFPQLVHYHKKPNNRPPVIETIEQFPASSNANQINIPTSLSSFGHSGPIKTVFKNGNTVSSITTISSPHSNIQTYTTTNNAKNHNYKITQSTQSPNLKNHKISYQVHEPVEEPIRSGLTYKELSPLLAMAETQIYEDDIKNNKHKKTTTTKSPTKNTKNTKRPRSSRSRNKHRN